MTSPSVEPSRIRRKIRWYRANPSEMVDLALRIIVILTLVGFYVNFEQQRSRDLRQDACLSAYAEDSARSQAARAQAAAQDREADRQTEAADRSETRSLRGIVEAVATNDPAKLRAAIAAALRAATDADRARVEADTKRAENERLRKLNPVPESPQLRCGKS